MSLCIITVNTYVLHVHKWIEMGLFYLVYQGFLYCSNYIVEKRNQLGTSSWIIFELIIRRHFFCKWYVQTKLPVCTYHLQTKCESLIVYNIQTGDLCIHSIYLYITLYRYYYNESKEKTLKDFVSSLRYWPHPRKWYMERADQVSGTAAFAFDQLNWPESKPGLSWFSFRKIREIQYIAQFFSAYGEHHHDDDDYYYCYYLRDVGAHFLDKPS